jgi:hypothetical protein
LVITLMRVAIPAVRKYIVSGWSQRL